MEPRQPISDVATNGSANGATELYLGSAVLGAYERSIAA